MGLPSGRSRTVGVLVVAGAVWTAATGGPLGPQTTASQACDQSPLVVTGVRVWNATGSVENRDVLFRDGRVAALADAGSPRPAGIRAIDGRGHTLVPGFVDSHLHFTIPGGLPAAGGPRTDVDAITSRQLLHSGVTAGRLHLASAEDAARLKSQSLDPCQPIPRLDVGGPGLSGAVEKDFSTFQGARTVADAQDKVKRFRAAGVDWLALHDAERFAPGVLEAIATTARAVGLRIMAAASTPQETLAALSVRPDTLDYFDRTAAAQYEPAVLEAIRAQQGLILVPTPGVPYRTSEYLARPDWLERDANFTFLREPDRAFVLATAKKDLGGPDAARATRMFATLPAKFQQLRALGVPMALGSDAGSTLHFQANAVWWELEAWRALGASHREALTAATVNGARVLGASDLGRLTAGSRANFVLYRGDVEEGPFDQTRVIAVGKDGVLFVQDGQWIGPPIPNASR